MKYVKLCKSNNIYIYTVESAYSVPNVATKILVPTQTYMSKLMYLALVSSGYNDILFSVAIVGFYSILYIKKYIYFSDTLQYK